MANSKGSREREAAPAGGLCVLLADEDEASLESLSELVKSLGHSVASRVTSLEEIDRTLDEDDIDVALVRVGNVDHALALIDRIGTDSNCPVVALVEREGPDLVDEVVERGVFGYVRPIAAQTLEGALAVAVQRHAELSRLGEEVDKLEAAIARRALIERAKGILMERHGIGDRPAFERIRAHARSSNRRVTEVAEAVISGHMLLPGSGGDAQTPG